MFSQKPLCVYEVHEFKISLELNGLCVELSCMQNGLWVLNPCAIKVLQPSCVWISYGEFEGCIEICQFPTSILSLRFNHELEAPSWVDCLSDVAILHVVLIFNVYGAMMTLTIESRLYLQVSTNKKMKYMYRLKRERERERDQIAKYKVGNK